jgi:hypothetical protein
MKMKTRKVTVIINAIKVIVIRLLINLVNIQLDTAHKTNPIHSLWYNTDFCWILNVTHSACLRISRSYYNTELNNNFFV